MKSIFCTRLMLTALSLILLTSCSDKSSSGADSLPPDAKGAINSFLPAYVTVNSVQVDNAGPNQYKFKSIVTVQEPLYVLSIQQPDLSGVSPVLDGSPPSGLQVLNQVNAAGASITVYGHFTAEKIVDKWTYSAVSFESGLEQLGKPAGSYPPGAVIAGTSRGDKALADFAAAVTTYKQKAAVVAEQQKQEANTIQKEKEGRQAAYRANLLDSIKAGASYEGTLAIAAGNFAMIHEGTSEPVKLTFTSLTGFLVKADASSPNNPSEHQSFTGIIKFDPNGDPNFYPLAMGPDKIQDNGAGWMFFWAAGNLNLRPVSGGLEGSAHLGDWGYSVSLQRIDKGSALSTPLP
jgi:hypothetical protein